MAWVFFSGYGCIRLHVVHKPSYLQDCSDIIECVKRVAMKITALKNRNIIYIIYCSPALTSNVLKRINLSQKFNLFVIAKFSSQNQSMYSIPNYASGFNANDLLGEGKHKFSKALQFFNISTNSFELVLNKATNQAHAVRTTLFSIHQLLISWLNRMRHRQ